MRKNIDWEGLRDEFTTNQAERIYDLVHEFDNPMRYKQAKEHQAYCQNQAPEAELIIHAINEIIGGKDVGWFRSQDYRYAFCNIESKEKETILYGEESGKFFVGALNDFPDLDEAEKQWLIS